MENPQNPLPSQIQVELSEREAEGIYSNVVFIAHSASEVILDFARALPGLAKAKVYARIIMTPQNARSLLKALEAKVDAYEAQFGKIRVEGDPSSTRDIGFKSS